MITITLDWLAVNFKEYTPNAQEFMRTYASFPPVVSATPRFGYSIADTDAYGAVIQWNPDRPEMGNHVIFAGSTLRNLFENTSVQQQALLRACTDAGGTVSRLDLAKDCTGKAIDLQAIYQSLEQGLNTGLARTYGKIQSNDGGFTIYVGSRQSERFIRIYNKAAQQNTPNERWFRFEIETKGKVARAISSLLARSTNWTGTFDALALGMVQLASIPDYQVWFEAESVPIGLPKIERQTDRERWIAEQVIAAVAKHYIENPNSEAIKRLIDTLLLIAQQQKE